MDRISLIKDIRDKLAFGSASVGSWMQIPNSSIAEIMGASGYDWVAIDMEHGAIAVDQLPDLFRALELGNTLPLVRVADGNANNCKQALDAGAGGIIVPMVESGNQLFEVINSCRWPPSGSRGVAFSRANLFGQNFNEYIEEAQAPLVVAMIESMTAVENIDEIFNVKGLDAIFVGPYDLSASMGLTAQFDDNAFVDVLKLIQKSANKHKIAMGMHIVNPSHQELQSKIRQGYQFVAYSIDSVMLRHTANFQDN